MNNIKTESYSEELARNLDDEIRRQEFRILFHSCGINSENRFIQKTASREIARAQQNIKHLKPHRDQLTRE